LARIEEARKPERVGAKSTFVALSSNESSGLARQHNDMMLCRFNIYISMVLIYFLIFMETVLDLALNMLLIFLDNENIQLILDLVWWLAS
jgi:hypothetical protein